MQTNNDGTHVISPAAAPIGRRPDRARLPVTLLRQTDGKLRHDGSSAAFVQPKHPVAERGRLHGASELDLGILDRDAENRFVYYRTLEKERRCQKDHRKHNRLRRQDKRPQCAAPLRSFCFNWLRCDLAMCADCAHLAAIGMFHLFQRLSAVCGASRLIGRGFGREGARCGRGAWLDKRLDATSFRRSATEV